MHFVSNGAHDTNQSRFFFHYHIERGRERTRWFSMWVSHLQCTFSIMDIIKSVVIRFTHQPKFQKKNKQNLWVFVSSKANSLITSPNIFHQFNDLLLLLYTCDINIWNHQQICRFNLNPPATTESTLHFRWDGDLFKARNHNLITRVYFIIAV